MGAGTGLPLGAGTVRRAAGDSPALSHASSDRAALHLGAKCGSPVEPAGTAGGRGCWQLNL